MADILPYQDGDSLPGDDRSTTEILESSDTAESSTNRVSVYARRYLWYEAARHSMLQLCLISTRTTRSLPLFSLMHSELRMRQKLRGP
jgi:hypothetical protein